MSTFIKFTIDKVIENPQELLDSKLDEGSELELKPVIDDIRNLNIKHPIVTLKEAPERIPSPEELLETFKECPVMWQRLSEDIKQREALIAFYEAANGKVWYRNDNWCTDASMGSWYGVTTKTAFEIRFSNRHTVKVQTVTKLELSHNNIYCGKDEDNGFISPRIGDLADLEVLNLSYNFIRGRIPEELWKLRKLCELGLHFNQLEGGISGEVGNLTNLVKLQLDHNHLTGSIPDEIGNLSNLEWLMLHVNNLDSGMYRIFGEFLKVPSRIGQLIAKKSPIPASIGSLTKLVKFYAYQNQLVGTVPAAVKDHPNFGSDDWSINPQQDGVMLD